MVAICRRARSSVCIYLYNVQLRILSVTSILRVYLRSVRAILFTYLLISGTELLPCHVDSSYHVYTADEVCVSTAACSK